MNKLNPHPAATDVKTDGLGWSNLHSSMLNQLIWMNDDELISADKTFIAIDIQRLKQIVISHLRQCLNQQLRSLTYLWSRNAKTFLYFFFTDHIEHNLWQES